MNNAQHINKADATGLDPQLCRYITTPIYYASGQPHAGHFYTSLIQQIMKSHHIAAGRHVLTLTGMDEHGEKIAEKALAAGMAPQLFVDGLKDQWQGQWRRFGMECDVFLRTTSAAHKATVQQIFEHCKAKGDIYFGEHEGRYCVDCEEFLTETQMDSDKNCLVHKRQTEIRREGNYFFRTTRYRDAIRSLVESGQLTRSRRYAAELLGMLAGLDADLSVSRPKTRTDWGIELPFDTNHVAYVWFDALPNYVTGVGGLDAARTSPYWHNAIHVLGKDILRFHGIYWPAMLMSLGLPIPELVVHGWLLDSGHKMSKSLGNVISLDAIHDGYGKDAFVNTVFRMVNPGEDMEVSEELVIERYNADLANGVGNLLSRTVTLALRAFGGAYPETQASRFGAPETEVFEEAAKAVGTCFDAMEEVRFSDALRAIWGVVSATDRYLTRMKPWELIKGPVSPDDPAHEQICRILGTACAALRTVGLLAHSFFPEKMLELLRCLGEDTRTAADFYVRAKIFLPGEAGRRIGEPPRLFPRKETVSKAPEAAVAFPKNPSKNKAAQHDVGKDRMSAVAAAGGAASVATGISTAANISFAQFAQVEIRVGLVEKAEVVDGSDKLIRLEIQLGALGTRQVFSGIREWVKPEDLAGRRVLVAANLEPRKMRFGVSEGMVLSTEDAEGRVSPVIVADHLEPGSKLA
jgi:methionyl-tRNA synthetase